MSHPHFVILFSFILLVWNVGNCSQALKKNERGKFLTETKLLFNRSRVSGRSQNFAWEEPLASLASSVSRRVQKNAVRGLFRRLLPNHHHLFTIKVDPSFNVNKKDVFKIVSPRAPDDPRVKIKGTTGVAVAWGLLYYLKTFCNAHVSWEADQLDLPDPLPKAYVKIVARDWFRYYQNVCTSSYSFAWWNWARWERHIDWMALNGINFPLAFTAQEEIWRRVYKQFNFTEEDLDDHFVGPAFLAWGRMGNIRKWMGPLSPHWHSQTLSLQHLILGRMRALGMIPILPAFAGHVPSAITRIYPEAKVIRLPAWGKFSTYTRTYLLDPRDKLFSKIGVAFIREMAEEFNGTNHVYNCDTFNEMEPPSDSPEYFRTVGKAIFNAMTMADPRAIWVMQGWIFRNKFWTYEVSKALLTSVPQGRMVVLDLASEVDPQYSRLESYFGQPFVFCMLHNYGGVDGLFGNAEVLLNHMEDARSYPNVTLVGTGLTPEGINQNYVIYDLMLELAWRKEPVNLTQWAHDYSTRRYGSASPQLKEAWATLMATVYNCKDPTRFHGNNILIQHRPNFKRKSYMWYNESDLLNAWDLFLSVTDDGDILEGLDESEDNDTSVKPDQCNDWFNEEESPTEKNHLNIDIELNTVEDILDSYDTRGEESGWSNRSQLANEDTFQHDLVDLSRQVLQVLGGKLINDIRKAYLNRSLHDLNETGTLLLDLFDDLDLLLGTSKDFLLGSWLRDASTWASNEREKKLYLANARYQVTLWGPHGEIVDYAVKQWNGLVRDYMKPRYKLFLHDLREALEKDEDFSQKMFDIRVFLLVEKPFADGAGKHVYPPHPQGDPIATVKYIYKKYRHFFDENEYFQSLRQQQNASVEAYDTSSEDNLTDQQN